MARKRTRPTTAADDEPGSAGHRALPVSGTEDVTLGDGHVVDVLPRKQRRRRQTSSRDQQQQHADGNHQSR